MKRALLAALLVACGSAPSESFGTGESEAVIGDRDFVRVRDDGLTPEKYRPLLDAFGKLTNYCTATHLGNGLVLTAGHCFGAPATRANDLPCPNVAVDWGYRRDKPAYLRSSCQVVLAAEHNLARDYAVFVVEPVPPVKATLDLAARPPQGRTITMFGHPLNRALEWSKTCSLEPASNLAAIGGGGTWGADMFTHQCDSERGSSGAAILDDESLAIVGIHNGGVVPWNYATFVVDTPVAEFLDPTFNVPPVIAFTPSTPVGTVRGTITIAVTASDPDGSLAKVTFTLPGGASVDVTSAPFAVTLDTSTVPDGGYTIAAIATDTRGAETRALRSLRIQNR